MMLALRSGIPEEVSWALDRLLRLCSNEKFLLSAIPGLTDALFAWPEWYVERAVLDKISSLENPRVGGSRGRGHIVPSRIEGATKKSKKSQMLALFADDPEEVTKRRHALEAITILRTATAYNDANVQELLDNARSRTLILSALHQLELDSDENEEFLVNILEIFHDLSSAGLTLPPTNAPITANPTPAVLAILKETSNRSLIIASFQLLALLFSYPANVDHITPDSAGLEAALRYLPLFTMDKELVDAALNFLYAHLACAPMARAFLLHPKMPSTLRVLVLLLLKEQVEEVVMVDLCPPPGVALAVPPDTVDLVLGSEDLETLGAMEEPKRCYEWWVFTSLKICYIFINLSVCTDRMKAMFVLNPEGELTQVEFFQLYSVTFTPFAEASPLLAPADVIKNVNVVYPSAQALLLPGPPQKFVVRGVARKQVKLPNQDRYKCQWDRGRCPNSPGAQNPGDLYDHMLSVHLVHGDSGSGPHHCLWTTCAQGPMSLKHLRSHVLTHIPLTQPFPRHSSQSDVVTLPDPGHQHPIDDPTKRPIVPPREFFVPSSRVTKDPPPMALTALLCVRVLFRTAFASAEAAPRADDDHFGFPGVIDDQDEGQTQQQHQQTRDAQTEDSEREGELRGRRAFAAVREMLGEVKIKDETLMGWVVEMVTAGTSG